MLILPQNSPSIDSIAPRLQQLRAQIAASAAGCGRSERSVTLVAVSKGHAVELLRAAARLGVEHLGESYLQEAVPKIAALRGLALSWHFIGRMQANKTRLVAEHFAWVHGIDRLQIGERLASQRPQHAPALNACIQVNIAGDRDKAGVTAEQAPALARALAALPRLRLRGLMCMLPEQQNSDARRRSFAALRTLMMQINDSGLALDTLSMGMSSDYQQAIQEGATIVRIGTAIFGSRPGNAAAPLE